MNNRQFYIVSVKNTRRDQPYITVLRPDRKGYAWPLSWAGRYSEAEVSANLDYFHSGCDTFAVACYVLDAICVRPAHGMVDGDAGPVVLNNKSSWFDILYAPFWAPAHTPYPEYKGARRQKSSEAAAPAHGMPIHMYG